MSLNNLQPSFYFKQILTNEGIFVQFYQRISLGGDFGVGFIVSKNFELSKQVNYIATVKGNFKDYNIDHKLTFKITRNFHVNLKAVSVSDLIPRNL